MSIAAFDVINPCDQSVLERLNFHDQAFVEEAFARAQTALSFDMRTGLHTRVSAMRIAARLLKEREEEFIQLMVSEGGKPIRDSRVEFARAHLGIEAAIAELYHLGGSEIPMGLTPSSAQRRAYTRRVPVGINLALCAFNHPLNLLIHQVVAPVLAGCPVILKPALKTPLTALKFVSLLHEAGIDERLIQLVLIPDQRVTALVEDSRVKLLNFIGSSKVGKMLASKASVGVRVLLEHGGAAPLIITKSALSESLGSTDLFAKAAMAHAGQVCVSLQNIFVPKNQAADFAHKLAKSCEALIVGNALDEKTDVGPLIRGEARARVLGVLRAFEESGKGEIILAPKSSGESFLTPGVTHIKDWNCELVEEEIFGPVVNVVEYEDLQSLCEFLSQSNYAFQAALWSKELSEVDYVERHLEAQALMINELPSFRVDWMPFGGFKDSGVGVGGFRATYLEVTREVLTVIKH